jgi:hypothetical protein
VSTFLTDVAVHRAAATLKAMMGSTRVVLGAGLLYVPFASVMLVMYDKAALKLIRPHILQQQQQQQHGNERSEHHQLLAGECL